MHVNWPTSSCILCTSRDCTTEEHLIPACLGGKLSAKFLCKDCNSTLGHREESHVRKDPMIVAGIERLASKRPDLADGLRKRLSYTGNSQRGEVRGYMRSGEFIVMEQRQDDGSLIVPDDKALDVVITKALRKGMESLIHGADDLSHLSPGESGEFAPGIWITKWAVDSVEPDLSGLEIDPVVPAKIAFEFLALHCGDDIYGNSPQINSIRRQLLAGELSESNVHVERLLAQNNRLFHGLVFEGNNPGACVQIRLFGRLAFRVQFRCLAIHCTRASYTHDLLSGDDDLFAVS